MMVNTIPTRTEIQVERYLIGLSSLNTRYAAAMLPTLYPAASAYANFVVEKIVVKKRNIPIKMAPEVMAFLVDPAVLAAANDKRRT